MTQGMKDTSAPADTALMTYTHPGAYQHVPYFVKTSILSFYKMILYSAYDTNMEGLACLLHKSCLVILWSKVIAPNLLCQCRGYT